MKRGDRIGILAFPSAKWVIMDLAIMVAGGVTVPLFANISDDNFSFEIMQTEMNTLVISGKDQKSVYARHEDRFNKVITFDEDDDFGTSYLKLLEIGKKLDTQMPG